MSTLRRDTDFEKRPVETEISNVSAKNRIAVSKQIRIFTTDARSWCTNGGLRDGQGKSKKGYGGIHGVSSPPASCSHDDRDTPAGAVDTPSSAAAAYGIYFRPKKNKQNKNTIIKVVADCSR